MNYKFAYKTFGCKVNQYETEKIREAFETQNIITVKNNANADALIINSCAVTETALSKLKKFININKSSNTEMKIALVGCAVDYLTKNNIIIKNVDAMISVADKFNTVKLLNLLGFSEIQKVNQSQLNIDKNNLEKFSGHSRAFVKIQDGCDNFCSYCIIPLLRNNLISRSVDEIIFEIENFILKGYYEIILTGINIQKYNYAEFDLTKLLKKICSLNYDFRIRLSSINVSALNDEFIQFFASEKKICKHLHISLQSGSDKILKLMNRGYTPEMYYSVVEKIKKYNNDTAITTDVIIGFPGETENDLLETVNLLKKIEASRTHIFPYSDRIGVAAVDLPDKISDTEKKRRIAFLKKITDELTDAFVLTQLNKIYRIVPEKEKKEIFGYTDNYIRGKFSDDFLLGNKELTKYYDARLISYDSKTKLAFFSL